MSEVQKLGVGVIGASLRRGWGGVVHLPSLDALPAYRIAAVCTSSRTSAEATAERYGGKAYTDPLQLVRDPDVDVVSVCVRSEIHYGLVKAALEAGKHVYCEWPLVQSSEQGRELVELAAANGVRTAVGLQARCAPVVMKVRDLIRSGYIGDVVSCTANYGSLTNGAAIDAARAYMVNRESKVGLLQIHGGHVLDTIRFCLGDFASVSSVLAVRHPEVTVTDTGETVTRTAPDQILVNSTFTSGAVGSVHVQGGKLNGGSFSLSIQGTSGDLEIFTRGNHAVQIETLELRGATGERPYAHHESAGHTFQPAPALDLIEVEDTYSWVPEPLRIQPFWNTAQLYARFAEDIRTGSHTIPDFAVATELLELIETIESSADHDSRQERLTSMVAP